MYIHMYACVMHLLDTVNSQFVVFGWFETRIATCNL